MSTQTPRSKPLGREIATQTGPHIGIRLFCACMYAGMGFQLAFFPVWLQASGLDARQIGFVIAAPLLVRLIANPVIATLADKLQAGAQILALLTSAAVLGLLLLSFAQGFAAVMMGVVFLAFIQAPTFALSDSVILAHLRAAAQHPRGRVEDYGRVRAWGSAAALFGMVLGGEWIGSLKGQGIIWLLAGAATITATAAFAMTLWPRAEVGLGAKMAGTSSFLRGAVARPVLVIIVIAAGGLIQASHAEIYTFGTLDWQRQGYSDGLIGMAWALGVLTEVLFFLFAQRALGRARPFALLCLGGCGATVRWALMARVPGLGALLCLQTMHALSFAATHLGTVTLLGNLVAPVARTRAQGWLAAVVSLLTFVLTLMSGILHARLGAASYDVMAGIAAAGLLLACAGSWLARSSSPKGPRSVAG